MDDNPRIPPEPGLPQTDPMSSLDFLTLNMLGLDEAELRVLLSPEELAAFRAFQRRDIADLDSGGI